MNNSEIILYQTDGGQPRFPVRLKDETAGFPQTLMAALFGRVKYFKSPRNLTHDSAPEVRNVNNRRWSAYPRGTGGKRPLFSHAPEGRNKNGGLPPGMKFKAHDTFLSAKDGLRKA